jgi:hypothetical protein
VDRRQVLAATETLRGEEQLGEEVAGLKKQVEMLVQENRRLLEAMELCPQSHGAPGLSNHFGELIAVVGLPGGSRVKRTRKRFACWNSSDWNIVRWM